MSCKFNVKNCITCPKYNGCLLQIVYTNTINLLDMINELSNNQQKIVQSLIHIQNSVYPKSLEDSIELFSNVDEISSKLDILTKMLENNEEDKNEMNIDLSQIQTALANIKLRIDNLLIERDKNA